MSHEVPKLSNNTRSYLHDSSFKNDTLGRKELGEKLTDYLERLNDGAVLAIDAPWGEGKTWFGMNWNKYLQEQNYKTIYIDTFEQDYIEDPFILITSEILNIIDKSNPKLDTLKKGSIEVTKALLPIGTKALLNFGGRVLLGSSDISQEVKDAIEAGKDATNELSSEWISSKLDNYTTDKATMEEFKKQLREYAEEQEKPIVIFIDELDRCKPTFAVELIERIKHFFDVPNIVFVLLLNRDQLEKAVKGVYGSETNASEYLDKFINFYFKLPKHNKLNHHSEQYLSKFVDLTLHKYKFTKEKETDVFKQYLLKWAIYFDLSLRDIEKCIALYAFAYPAGDFTWTLVYFIAFKIKYRNLFNRLIENDSAAHGEAKHIVEEFIRVARRIKDSTFETRVLPLYLQMHTAHETEFNEVGNEFQELAIGSMWGIEKEDYFRTLAKTIDIDIER